jgi:hypothetical protein
MINKLKLTDEAAWKTDEGFLAGPAVMTVKGEDGQVMLQPVYGVHVEMVDEKPHAGVSMIDAIRYYPLVRPEDVRVSESRGDITFSSYGKIYTVRAFQDTDGRWASSLRTTVPAEALEEMYMADVKLAFTPNAPAPEDNLYAAVDTESQEVKYLVYSSEAGMYTRSNRGWFKLPADDESIDGLEVHEVTPKFIKIYDMAEGNDETLTTEDTAQYEDEESEPITAAADGDCPPATQDVIVNLENREYAIKNAGYGPLNPNEPNDEFWDDKGTRWGVSGDEARKSTCGNCVMFIRTPKMLDCITTGIEQGGSSSDNAWDAVDAAELGYCEALDFKCAASRTCNAWVVGGPITEEE